MSKKFKPAYQITSKIANSLIRIEAVKTKIIDLPINPHVIKSLRETARLFSTHYSTAIEGNRLTQQEVELVVRDKKSIKGKLRDEKEVKAYYLALAELEKYVLKKSTITEKTLQNLHALVMGEGKANVKPTPYRNAQNVIKDSYSGRIVYMPPEAKDVAPLMKGLTDWLKLSAKDRVPCAIRAAIAHYQFATIHPYFDGNGRTARLLTNLVLHLGGYDLKGLYSLEEYYAKNLSAYYEAISIGPSHNYYFGRAKADITSWIEYFCHGMAISFETVLKRAKEAKEAGFDDHSLKMMAIEPIKRRALELFLTKQEITAADIAKLLGYKPRTASKLCNDWTAQGFLTITNPAKKSRKYTITKKYKQLIKHNAK